MGCDERVLKCDYARHCRERFDEHAVMVLRNDANKWARPGVINVPGDEPSDPRPDEPEARRIHRQERWFRGDGDASRADPRRPSKGRRRSATQRRFGPEIASAREEIARVEDEVTSTPHDWRSICERQGAHARAGEETDDEVQAFETKLWRRPSSYTTTR